MKGLDRQALSDAAERLAGQAHRTPVMTSKTLDARTGGQLFFKCENLQRVGAFKFRGAYNTISTLGEAERQRGLVTHSSGNHGQAVALAARLFGAPATIVMPEGAPAVKAAAVEGYGARVVFCEPTMAGRKSAAQREIERTGATFVHPYDDPRIVTGQATATWELLEEVPDLDYVLVPVGGGGLAAGSSLVAHHFYPKTQVIACEPSGADDAAQSFAEGSLLEVGPPQTIADGLRATLSELTFSVIKRHAAAVVTVDDELTVAAMRFVWERMKLIVEPSSAVPMAALLSGPLEGAGFQIAGKRIGIVISGGNVDLGRLPWQGEVS